jgi:biotin carboxyl carrier protein
MELIVLRDGEESRVEIEAQGRSYRLRVGDRSFVVDSVATNGAVRSLVIEGRQFEVSVRRKNSSKYNVSHQGFIDEVEVLDPLTYLAKQGSAKQRGEGPQQVLAYMPGRVVEILVEEGQAVQPGQGLIVLEAMKMENEIQAEHEGLVTRVFVTAGQPVEGGDPLFEFE